MGREQKGMVVGIQAEGWVEVSLLLSGTQPMLFLHRANPKLLL